MDVNSDKKDFDKDAAKWDENPRRVQLAADVARSMAAEVSLTVDMDVLDFGCGTGLVTLALQPHVRSITGADSSQGMLDVLNRKISDRHLANAGARYVDLDRGDTLSGSYHLIVSSMTLHHIKDVDAFLKQLYQRLHPSGILCIADLDEEGGKFHESNEGVFHFGFHRETLARQFEKAGFQNVRTVQAASMEKPVAGVRQRFTIFLTIGMRPSI